MGKVLKDRKTILRTFMTNLKAKKQSDDSKGSYQKAQERVIARKTALARKRARETAAKHQAALKAVIEDDKLLPNQDPLVNPFGDLTLHPVSDSSLGERFLKHGTSE